jgi:hypothetical protein
MTAGPIAPTITMPAGSYTTNRDTTFKLGRIDFVESAQTQGLSGCRAWIEGV